MAGCRANSFFLSEVLVILSSCVFVVMALLTAVVSVTSITFTDKNENTTVHHTNLPNRFSIRSSFDLQSYSLLYTQFLTPEYKNQSSFISALRFFILSSLRDTLIEREILSIDRSFSFFSDNLLQIIDNIFTSKKTTYNISKIPSNAIYSLISKDLSNQYHSISIKSQSSTYSMSFIFNYPSFLFDIEAIKSTLVNKSRPVVISIPFDILTFIRNEENVTQYSDKFDSSFLQNSTYLYIIYGWNDDFLFRIPSTKNNDYLTGGFIVRQFIQETISHSISYYYGNLTTNEETHFCPKLSQFLNFNKEQKKMRLICKNHKKCNTSLSYYFLESNNTLSGLNITFHKNSTMTIGFLEETKKGVKQKIFINFKGFEEFQLCFAIGSQKMTEQCNYLFIPFDVFKKAFAHAKTAEQMAYGISSTIQWSFDNNIDFTNSFSHFTQRPTLLFEI